MYMRPLDRTKFYVPTQEEMLERRIARDNAVLKSLRAGRRTKSVAAEFGLTPQDVREIAQADKSRRSAMNRASRLARAARLRKEAREARAASATWPPARIRNVLSREFGIPFDRVGDAFLIAETVTRGEIEAVPMAGVKTADSVSAYLAGHGLSLRD